MSQIGLHLESVLSDFLNSSIIGMHLALDSNCIPEIEK